MKFSFPFQRQGGIYESNSQPFNIMERSKRNARALIVLAAIVIWAWFGSEESSDQDDRPVVRHRPHIQRYEPRRFRSHQPGIDFPALPEGKFDVSKISSSIESEVYARPKLQISEIFYHPPGSIGEEAEFIELHHTGDTPLNVGLWRFTKGIQYIIPEDTVLAPGEVIILCKDLQSFRETYGDTPKVLGSYKGGLKNSGEKINLKDLEGSTRLSIEFDDKAPWPEASDGDGDSLQLKLPSSHPADPTQWASLPPTPGIATSLQEQPSRTSLFGLMHEPSTPTSTDNVLIQASIFQLSRDTKIQLHLEINGTSFDHEIVNPIPSENPSDLPYASRLHRLTVNLPPLPQNTVLRYWFSMTDSQGSQLRFPPLDRPTANEAYCVQDEQIESKLPIYHLMMRQQDLIQMHASARMDQTYPAAFIFNGEIYDQVKVRVRGAFARSWPKKSLKIFFNKDRLFQEKSRLNLNSGWWDPAFIREHMSYRIYEMAEAYSLETKPVRLQVNGKFWGLFTSIQQPDKRYLEDRSLKGATLYKADSRNNQSDERMFPSEQEYEFHYEKETREEDSYGDLADFCKSLEMTDDVPRFFEQRVDIERYINFLCAGTLCQNWDGFNKNHFVGFDSRNTGHCFALPWDLDRTLGDHWDWSFDYYQLPLFLGQTQQPGATGWNRIADRLFNEPSLRNRYLHRLKQLIDEVFTEENLFTEITELMDQIGTEADLDRSKWGGERDWRHGVEEVKYFIKHRRTFLLQAIDHELRTASPGI